MTWREWLRTGHRLAGWGPVCQEVGEWEDDYRHRVEVLVDPRDAWVGAYLGEAAAYLCPLPFLVLRVSLGPVLPPRSCGADVLGMTALGTLNAGRCRQRHGHAGAHDLPEGTVQVLPQPGRPAVWLPWAHVEH
jgi:hypothetical protein